MHDDREGIGWTWIGRIRTGWTRIGRIRAGSRLSKRAGLGYACALLLLAMTAGGCQTLPTGVRVLSDVLTESDQGSSQERSSDASPASEPEVQRADVRGVWEGVLRGAGLPRSGLRVRLALGSAAHLLIEDAAPVPLTSDGREGEAFVFAAPAGTSVGGAEVARVVAEPHPRRPELRLSVERTSEQRPAVAQLVLPGSLEALRRGPAPLDGGYYTYENWRTRAGGAPYDEERIWTLVRSLEDDGWECITDHTLTVPPGVTVAWQAPEQAPFDTELYLIRAEDGAEHLAFSVGRARGVGYHLKVLSRRTDYPVLGADPNSFGPVRPLFRFHLREGDPDRAVEAEAALEPVKVTIIKFANHRSYEGRGNCDARTW